MSDAPDNPDVPHEKIEQWAARYIESQRSVMRGGRRKLSRKEVRKDLVKAFPGSGAMWLLWIAYWVLRIWLSL